MSNRCPISGKFVPRQNPSGGDLVLSPEGEEVRFCCPSHKTRYLRENPGSVDLKGRYIPEKYLAGLSEKERLKRIKELGESRDEYGTGDWSELPSDRVARKKGLVKLSAYRKVAMKRGFDISQVKDLKAMARKALRYYTGSAKKADVEKLTADLEHVYDKGLAAWKSGGHRPGATATNWGDARVASLLVGGKAAWTADKKQANRFPAKMREAVIRQMPEVLSALRGYDNTDAVDYLEAKYAKVMRGRKR